MAEKRDGSSSGAVGPRLRIDLNAAGFVLTAIVTRSGLPAQKSTQFIGRAGDR